MRNPQRQKLLFFIAVAIILLTGFLAYSSTMNLGFQHAWFTITEPFLPFFNALSAKKTQDFVMATPNPRSAKSFENRFTPKDVQVGDTVGSLKLTKFDRLPITPESYHLQNLFNRPNPAFFQFDGEVTLRGEVFQTGPDDFLHDAFCLKNLDRESIDQLPMISEDREINQICFAGDYPMEVIDGLNLIGQNLKTERTIATITVKNLTLVSLPQGQQVFGNMTKISGIQDLAAASKFCRSTKKGFSYEYPFDWYGYESMDARFENTCTSLHNSLSIYNDRAWLGVSVFTTADETYTYNNIGDIWQGGKTPLEAGKLLVSNRKVTTFKGLPAVTFELSPPGNLGGEATYEVTTLIKKGEKYYWVTLTGREKDDLSGNNLKAYQQVLRTLKIE